MKPKYRTIITASGAGVILIAIDFLTKILANRRLPFEEVKATFLPFLNLYRTHNTGYHFLFGTINNHFIWALVGLIFVTVLIASLIHSLLKEDLDRFSFNIYAGILALTIGATGNVLEILIVGHATDFFIFTPFPWPSNLCDQYINGILYIALPILIVRSAIEYVRKKKNKKSESSTE